VFSSDIATSEGELLRVEGEDDVPLNLEELERRAIATALAHTEQDRLKAAKILGISRSTLYAKLKKYRIGVG
jgi:DNA-binding NtrC family response regulator